jgi:hypothetical protein
MVGDSLLGAFGPAGYLMGCVRYRATRKWCAKPPLMNFGFQPKAAAPASPRRTEVLSRTRLHLGMPPGNVNSRGWTG